MPNKALHPTAYSFVPFARASLRSLRFRRRVSLVVVWRRTAWAYAILLIMRTQESDKMKITPLVVFKYVLLWWPLIVFMPALVAKPHYWLVWRNDTIYPVMGVPRPLFYIALAVTIGYALTTFTFCREQFFAVFRNRIPTFPPLLIMSFLFCPLSVWAVGNTLNILLDSSAPQKHHARIQGLHYIKSTQYAKAQDWRDPNGYVLFMGGQKFLHQHPQGSTVTVVTKKGAFGYEYVIDIS